jgi:hypothetical protein
MKDGEDHLEMYRRLKAIATTFKNLGAHHIDDEWIKMKYVLAYTTPKRLIAAMSLVAKKKDSHR